MHVGLKQKARNLMKLGRTRGQVWKWSRRTFKKQ